jgi:cytochrome c oxidase subunit 2
LNTRQRFGHLFSIELTIAAVVFALVCATLLFALIRSRTRWGRRASQKTSHPRIEATYLAVVTAVAVFVVVLSFSSNDEKAPGPPQVRIQAIAFQWCWRFVYEGTAVSVTGECRGGDIPTLVLPTNRVIEVDLASSDVVHSFWVPYLRFKEQAFPNHTNTFTTDVPRAGTYRGECAEFCGLYHDEMDFTVKAVPPAQFAGWLRSQEATT